MDPKSALSSKLQSALTSREERWIRRRLPDPITSPSSTPAITSLSSSSPIPPTIAPLIDFNSNDYLSLSQSPTLRSLFLRKLSTAPDILGSGGSRLLVNGRAHATLEDKLARFFCGDNYEKDGKVALLFNSGYDANHGFFACIPQPGDLVIYDEYIHASVHDGIRASRIPKSCLYSFAHNSLSDLRKLFQWLIEKFSHLKEGKVSLFVSVESLYSMDGTFSPLREIADMIEELFPLRNAYLVVDEAHSTGVYGPQGRGRVAQLGLENRVLARLHTFGKALAATGAVIVTNTLVRDYLLNYARSLIYTTSLSYANIIAADCSFDMLEDGTATHLSNRLQQLSTFLCDTLRQALEVNNVPPSLVSLPSHLSPSSPTNTNTSLSLSSKSSFHPHPSVQSLSLDPPSPIIPILTPHPRPLSSYLLLLGMNARPITWPTVPKGKDRVRVCLHAGNSEQDVRMLVQGIVRWAREVLDAGNLKEVVEMEVKGGRGKARRGRQGGVEGSLVESKL